MAGKNIPAPECSSTHSRQVDVTYRNFISQTDFDTTIKNLYKDGKLENQFAPYFTAHYRT